MGLKKRLNFGILLVFFLISCGHENTINAQQSDGEDPVNENSNVKTEDAKPVPISVPACDVPLGEIIKFLMSLLRRILIIQLY